MAIGYGFEAQAVLKKGATWGTAVTPTLADALYLTGENIASTAPLLEDEALTGSAMQRRGDIGEERFEGTIDTHLTYEGLDLLFNLLMGTANTPGAIASGVYYNEFVLLDDLDGLFGTLIIEKGANRDSYASVKVNSLDLSWQAGQRPRCSWGLICDDLTLSSTAFPTTGAVPTYAATLALASHLDVRMAAQTLTGSPLDTDDRIYPNSFTLRIENNLRGDITTRRSTLTDEPHRDGRFRVTGSIGFPVYSQGGAEEGASALDTRTAFLNKTLMMMSVWFTGAAIGAENLAVAFLIPQLQITTEAARAAGQGRIVNPFDFICTASATAITPANLDERFNAGAYAGNTRVASSATPYIYRLNSVQTNPA
ncbi:MAG: hypothetical protein HYY96_01285 [Candidatus Tectomicrobia bacterium]|nr:hypothetical protein [Candidatus Tectomicrobia bacterium]